jgi:hypothetical protein
LLLDPAASGLAPAARPVQQHPACRQQLTASQRCDDGLVQFCKDAN